MEAFCPGGVEILCDGSLKAFLFVRIEPNCTRMLPEMVVVVARHEHLFDTTSVNSLVVREYRIPSRADMAQLFRQTLIHNVAGYYNAVNLLRIKPLQCPDERIKAPARFADVRVAQDTHAQVRLGLRRESAHIWCSRKRQDGFDEVSSAHWRPFWISAFITEPV